MGIEDRFWEKVDTSGDCWEWMASKNAGGYGQFSINRRPALAHRISWQIAHGFIPDGAQLDHLCRNRGCVNPDHLEPVDNRTNTLRGTGPTAINAAKTVCKRGHSLADAYVSKGMRYCRTCALEKKRLLRTQGHGVLPC